MLFSSHQQSNVDKCETVFKNLIENLPLSVALNVLYGNML